MTDPAPTYEELRARRRSFREDSEDEERSRREERREVERWVLGG